MSVSEIIQSIGAAVSATLTAVATLIWALRRRR